MVGDIEEKLESKFDMTLADMQVIDIHRKHIHNLFLALRSDVRVVLDLLDSCKLWYLVLLPYCRADEREKYDLVFKVCYKQGEFELRSLANVRSQRHDGQFRLGASEGLLLMVEELIRDLYILKNFKGLGIKQKKSFSEVKEPFLKAVR